MAMIRTMRNSPSLLEGTLALIDAMLQSRAGPAFEGQISFLTIWAECIRMTEAREEGVDEIIRGALGRIQGQWDMISGNSTRARIMEMAQEDIAKLKRERQRNLE